MDYPVSEKGRCRSCGFLSQRFRSPSFPGHFEVEDRSDWREYLVAPTQAEATTVIECFVKAFSLADEVVAAHVQERHLSEAARIVFDRDRKCPKWYPWTPGFSPKEHLEELRTKKLEDERRRFEVRLTVGITGVVLLFAALEGGEPSDCCDYL